MRASVPGESTLVNVARCCAALCLVAAPLGAQPRYKDPRVSVDARAQDLLARMTLEEKFWQLFMTPVGRGSSAREFSAGVFGVQNRAADDAQADAELYNLFQRHLVDSTRLGIPMIAFEEAVHGLMRRGAVVYPAAIALAATFDSTLMRDVAASIAGEARARGVRQVLSPVVNLATDVRWGRVEETYGEDPFLASVMARAFVREFQDRSVIATPKHFVANVGEGGRDSYPVDVSLRSLEEVHFPPFRAALDAGAGSVMTAYNSVDGMPATQSRALMRETLRRDWGFGGFVISDQSAVGGAVVLHRTEASTSSATRHALSAGLDVIFQSSYDEHRPYLEAFRDAGILPSVIDSAVARVLRAKFQLGLFEQPYVMPDSASSPDRVEHARKLAREAARQAIVLLKNDRGALPLPGQGTTIAVIGADAAEGRLGGYTLDGTPAVSILDGLRARFGTRVLFHPGPGRSDARHAVVAPPYLDSLYGEYFDNITLQGAPRLRRPDANIDFRWTFNAPARSLANDWYSVRWIGRLRAPEGVRSLGVEGSDGYRLYLDGRLLIDNWRKQSYRATLAPVSLAAGSVHDLRLEFFENTGSARVRLVWDTGTGMGATARTDSAVALARRSDAVIVVAGIEEGEFRDRASLALPGRQEELILGLAEIGKPLIVVLVGGSAITMSRWIDKADAVLMAWYPGAEGGHAVADVLLGDVSPGGRLPVTFPMSEGQLPLTYNHKPTGRGDDYVDLTGQPAFPFGFGLSYAAFEYRDLRIEPRSVPVTGRATISFRVKNTGTRAGDDVPQLYVRDVLSSVARPVMELKGFTRLRLAPGEEREVAFTLDASALRMLDERMRWVVEPGVTRILVGASSKDVRLRGDLEVRP